MPVTVRVADPAGARWGFQLSTRPPDGCTQAGTLAPANGDVAVISDAGMFSPCTLSTIDFAVHRVAKFGGSEVTFTVNWTAPSSDIGPVVFATAGNAANGNNFPTGDNIYTVQETVEAAEGGGGGPTIAAGGIVDAAQFQPSLSRGGIGSIFGSNLADGIAGASDTPLPTEVGGVRVDVNGVLAPLFFVSPGQFNFQMPFEAPLSGQVEVRVIRDGEPSPPVTATLSEYAPAVFINPNTDEPIIQRHPDGALITANNPAEPGDVLIIFMTGIGDVSSPPPSGAASLASPLATANLTPTVTVGGAPAQVFFAGLAPFFVGLGQLNIQLPSQFAQTAALRTGAAQEATLPLVIAFGESRSQAVNLPVAGVTP